MAELAIFTAIPAGRLSDGRLKVTVFVTPRLTPETGPDRLTVDAYPAFGNWAQTVGGAEWAIEVDGTAVDARPAAPFIAPEPRLWERLFEGVPVGGATFQDFSRAVVHSYPVDAVTEVVHGLYRRVAVQSPTQHPPISTGVLADAVAELHAPLRQNPRVFGDRAFNGEPGGIAQQRQAIRSLLAGLRTGAHPGQPGAGRFVTMDTVPAADRAAVAVALAGRFYDRATAIDDPPIEPPATPPDFHSFVARCADYPDLLRRLGLAIDLAIEDAGGPDANIAIRVAGVAGHDALLKLADPETARPRTRTHRSDRVWAPAPRPDERDIVDGSLALDAVRGHDTPVFTVDQLDPDGAVLKLAGLLDTLARTGRALQQRAGDGGEPSMTADESSIPALRSTGLIIARHDRAASMVGQFDRSAGHESSLGSGRPTTLDATDVTRGWRVDVRDRASGSGEWRSLHRRVVDYDLGSGGEASDAAVKDEGYLKAASMSSQGSSPSDDQYLHETLAGWDGWSLAATRPGRPVDGVEAVDPSSLTPADTGFDLAPRVRVEPGSLPRLRFGRRYDVRVRAVDLSGQSIPPEQLDDAHEHRMPLPYQRWEPVPSPTVLPLTQYTEGESLMRMVIRSTDDATVAEYLALPRIQSLAGHDVSPGGAGDPDGLTAGSGVVYRPANLRHLAAPIGSVQLAETHGLLDAAFDDPVDGPRTVFELVGKEANTFLTTEGAFAVDPATGTVREGPWRKDDTLASGWYLLRPARRQSLPYLPDPLARGVSLTGLPGEPGGAASRSESGSVTRPLRWPANGTDTGDWTDRQPIVVRVIEGAGAPVYDEASRTLTVELPKATVATVRLSSFLDDQDVDLLRVWQLIDSGTLGGAKREQREDVRDGRHWMITPFAELTLVHAVERPLTAPVIVPRVGGQLRLKGETFSSLPGVVQNHAASTGRIDIAATWDDPVDDVLAPRPGTMHHDAHVGDFALDAGEGRAAIGRDDAFRTTVGATTPVTPVHRMRHEFGDTRHHVVRYTPTATTRFREYFPAVIADDPALTTVTGGPVEVSVPSSARPAAPIVRYIVPYWEWHGEPLEVDGSPLAVHRTRSAGGLRVYLDRPWYSSGDGELLGVVLARNPVILVSPHVTIGRTAAADLAAFSHELSRAVGSGATVQSVVGDRAASLLAERRAEEDATRPSRATSVAGRFAEAVSSAVRSMRGDRERVTASARLDVAGELIGGVASLAATGAAGRRFTTVWGADPVFASNAGVPGGPYAFHFPRAVAAETVTLAEVDDLVTVVGHRPEFDEDRGLWYCDIEVDAGDAYTPFVRFALARYQPSSVDGVEISPVVITDFAQQLPRRDATFVVTPDQRGAAITVAGPVGVPEHAIALPDLASRITASRRIEAWVERMPRGAASDLDWQPVGEPVVLGVRLTLGQLRGGDATAQWYGSVALPERVAGERLRIQLAEYEVHEGDDIAAPLLATGHRRPVRGLRLIYADTVEVPPGAVG